LKGQSVINKIEFIFNEGEREIKPIPLKQFCIHQPAFGILRPSWKYNSYLYSVHYTRNKSWTDNNWGVKLAKV